MGKKRYSSILGVGSPENNNEQQKNTTTRTSSVLGNGSEDVEKKKTNPLEFPLPSAPQSEQPKTSSENSETYSGLPGLGFPSTSTSSQQQVPTGNVQYTAPSLARNIDKYVNTVEIPKEGFRKITSVPDYRAEGQARLKATEERMKSLENEVPQLLSDIEYNISKTEDEIYKANIESGKNAPSIEYSTGISPEIDKKISDYYAMTSARDILKKTDKYLKTKDAGVLKTIFTDPLAVDFFTLGINEISRGKDLLLYVNKLKNGEELSESEALALYALGMQQDIQSNTERSISSSVGAAIPEMVSFMVQFAATKGVAGSSEAVAREGMTKLLKSLPESVLKKYTSIAVSELSGAALRTTMMPEFYSGISERQIGVVEPVVENGKLSGVPIKETQAGFGEALAKSYATTLTDVATEGFGKYADKGISLVAKKYGLNSMAGKLSNETIKSLRTATGFNNIFSEFVVEEIPAAYIQGAIEGQKMSDVWDNKQMLTTFLTIAATGGAFGAADFSLNKINGLRNESISSMRETEKNVPVEKQVEIDNILKGENIDKNVEQLDSYIKKQVAGGATKEQITNIVNYAGQKVRVQEMNNTELNIETEIQKEHQEQQQTETQAAPKEKLEADIPELKPIEPKIEVANKPEEISTPKAVEQEKPVSQAESEADIVYNKNLSEKTPEQISKMPSYKGKKFTVATITPNGDIKNVYLLGGENPSSHKQYMTKEDSDAYEKGQLTVGFYSPMSDKFREDPQKGVAFGEAIMKRAASKIVKPQGIIEKSQENISLERNKLLNLQENSYESNRLDKQNEAANSFLKTSESELLRENNSKTSGGKSRYDVGEGDGAIRNSTIKEFSIPENDVKKITISRPKATFDTSFSEISDSDKYISSITESKNNNPYSASVFIYPKEKYDKSRKLITNDGKAGAAIDENGTIISVFSYGEGKGRASQIIMQAIKEGGNKLDHYDTALTGYYYDFGFVPVAKVKWDDKYAPEDWNKEAFKEYNNGEPDVILMAYDGGNPETLSSRFGKFSNKVSLKEALDKAPYVETFEEGQKLQDAYLKNKNKKSKQTKVDAPKTQSKKEPKKQAKKQPKKQAKKQQAEADTFKSAFTKGTDSALKWLDEIDNQLKKFEQETLGINIPVAVARTAIKAAKLAVEAGKTISEAVDAAINAVKKSDWYNGLDDKQKKQADSDVSSLFETPKENIMAEDAFKAIPGGQKERKTASKAKVSDKLSDQIKEIVSSYKGKYEVSKHTAMKEKFADVVDEYIKSNQISELKSVILNQNNNIEPEPRVILGSMFVDRLEELASIEPYLKKAEKYRLDSKEVFADFLLPLSTQLAKGLKAYDVLSDVIGRNPDVYVESVREKINDKNEPVLEAHADDVKNSKEIIDEFINSNEFKKNLDEKVKQAISDKKQSQDRIERGRAKMASGAKKIAEAFQGMKFAVAENEIKGPDAAKILDGLVEFADGLLDIGVASADELMKKLKVRFREYLTPSEIEKYKSQIIEKNKAKERYEAPKKKYSIRSILSDKELDSVINKIYSKMVSADKKQLKQLAVTYLDRVVQDYQDGKPGAINEKAFKEMFANAIGLDTLTEKHEETLRDIAGKLNDARTIADNLESLYRDAEKLSKDKGVDSKAELKKIKGVINEQLKIYSEAEKAAREANKKASELFADKMSIGDLFATFMQGNLITAKSLITNVAGNSIVLIQRSATYLLASAIDSMSYAVLKRMAAIGRKYSKINFIRRNLSTIDPKKHFAPAAAAKGYAIGTKDGLIEGLQQLVSGQLPEDVYQREIVHQLEPIKAWIKNYNMLSGKDKLKIDNFIKNVFEGTLGVAPETIFRLLNLGDKPFRRAAEKSKLYELAETEGLKGVEAEHFINFPPEWAAEEARQAGLIATYQQDNFISDALLKAGKTSNKKLKEAKETLNKIDKALWGFGRFFFKANIPFVKTPTNVMTETFDYGIPLISLAKAFYYTKSGDVRQAELYFAKTIVGLMIDNAITALIYSGAVTLGAASGEDDEEAKRRVRESEYRNKNAYYLNKDALKRYLSGGDPAYQDGDRLVSYQRLGLVSAILMGRAEAARSNDLGEKEDIFSSMTNVSRQVTSVFPMVTAALQQSYLSGVNTLLNGIMSGKEEDTDKWLINMSKAFSAAVVPQTFVKINDYKQEFMKERRDEVIKAMNKKEKRQNWEAIKKEYEDMYGSGDSLTNKLTVWGEDIRYIPKGEGLSWYLFDITATKEYAKGDFGVKLHELYERTGDESILPALDPIKVKYEGVDIKLPADLRYALEKEFRTLRKSEVEQFVNSTDYDMMTDEERITALTQLYDIVNTYRGQIVSDFVSANEDKIMELYNKQQKAASK